MVVVVVVVVGRHRSAPFIDVIARPTVRPSKAIVLVVSVVVAVAGRRSSSSAGGWAVRAEYRMHGEQGTRREWSYPVS